MYCCLYASEMKGLLMHLSGVTPVRPVLLVVGMCATGAGQSRKLSSHLQLLISDGWSTAATGTATQLYQGACPAMSRIQTPAAVIALISCIKYDFTFVAILFPHTPYCTQTTISRVSPNCQIIPYKPRPCADALLASRKCLWQRWKNHHTRNSPVAS